MDINELMRMSAEKAARELSRESIDFLFRPTTVFELLLRLDFDGMRKKTDEWAGDDSPDAMPHRFRGPYIRQMRSAIQREKFYREIVAAEAEEQ